MAELALATTEQLFVAFDTVKFKQKLAAVIPETLRPERMIQLAVTLIKSSETLMKCRPLSLYACVVECAQLGLELDHILGHAYIVPFKSGDSYVATLIIGYRGYCHLAYQSGQVAAISAEVVRPKDKFQLQLGTERRLIHIPAPVPLRDNYEQWRGAYAVGKQVSGTTQFEWMESEKIFSSRARSQSWRAFLKDSSKQSPWDTDAEEMWRKTPIRRLAKLLPRSTTDKRHLLLRAAMLDEYGERGLLMATEEGFQVNQEKLAAESEPPIAPTMTLEAQLQESIEVVNAKKDKPGREKKKPPKEKDRATWESTHCPHCGISMANLDPKTSGVMHLTGKCKEQKYNLDISKTQMPPKASIPAADFTAAPAKPGAPPAKMDDPTLTVAQQTLIYNAAIQAGWKIPEEFSAMLKKNYKLNSIQHVRNSQFAEILRIAKEGTGGGK